MSLLAESLVEEWLNRKGFFTIRGIRHGAGEMDLLGIRHEPSGSITGWHVEVQASFRPIGYITKSEELGYVKRRTQEQVEVCVRGWVGKKFRAKEKVQVRERLWPDINWEFHLVHAVSKHPEELVVFQHQGVKCHPFSKLLDELTCPAERTYSGSAGGDLAEIVGYYKSEKQV
jgi:hypothetical protein